MYHLKDKDKITLTGKQLREFKLKVIKDFKRSEYYNTQYRRGRRNGFIEGIECIRQWIINEGNLDPEPCCNGIRIINIISKIEDLKKQGDKRIIIDEKHLRFIKQMLKEGFSKNEIAKELKVSISTIVYWTNPKFRNKQMQKNAKNKYKYNSNIRREQGE